MISVRELHVSSSRIEELIDSGQFSLAEKLLGRVQGKTPLLNVLRAQMEIYFWRLPQAEMLLNEAAHDVKDIELAARYSLTRGELCCELGEYESAEERFQSAYHFYKFLGDTLGQAAALYHLGRLKCKCARFDEAEALLEKSSEAHRACRDS